MKKKIAVRIAREALAAAVRGEAYSPAFDSPSEAIYQEKRGCFVTLKTAGRLRGCLGCFTATEPLSETIAEYTRRSVEADPRFANSRLQPAELPTIALDISILSPLRICPEPLAIEIGKQGIYIKAGARSGCYLPQVAPQQGWDAAQFWTSCCGSKAGLAADAWATDSRVTLLTFTAEVIEDPAPVEV